MIKKKLKRMTALVLALVLMVGAVLPTAAYANATGQDMDALADDTAGSQTETVVGSGNVPAGEGQELVLYNETDRPDLETAESIITLTV